MNLSGSFYRDKPLFGLDIGHSSLKIMQIDKQNGKDPVITGYGVSHFAPEAMQNGVIIKPDVMAKAAHNLFERDLVGSITSKRVACSLPTSHSFSRLIRIPAMDHGDITQAIRHYLAARLLAEMVETDQRSVADCIGEAVADAHAVSLTGFETGFAAAAALNHCSVSCRRVTSPTINSAGD